MKKITHVIASLGTGGTEIMCLRLARYWQSRFEQSVIAWSFSSRSLEAEFVDVTEGQLSTLPNSRRSYFTQFSWIQTLLKKNKPDALLIHCLGMPHLIAAAAACTAGTTSLSAWAGNPPPQHRGARLRYSTIVLASRLLHCPIASCSASVEQELRRLGVGLPARSTMVPNAIDVAQIAMTAEISRKMRCDVRPVIAMISRLDSIKDHATLLEAFAKIHRELRDAELWIIGDGPLRADLEERTRSLGIELSVRFLGNKSNVASLLGQIDVFAFSTTCDEGFGIVLIEAMAAGVPIVASDVAACREVLAGGEAGMLVRPADPAAMAAALGRVLASRDLRDRLTRQALHRVRSEYSLESCARRWENQLFGKPLPTHLIAACAS